MFRAQKMHQFRIIVYDTYVEPTVRAIGDMGLCHFDQISSRIKNYEGLLEEVKPSDKYYRLINLQSRIEKLFELLSPKWLKPKKSKSPIEHQSLTETDLVNFDAVLKDLEERAQIELDKVQHPEELQVQSDDVESGVAKAKKPDKTAAKAKAKALEEDFEKFVKETSPLLHSAQENLQNELAVEETLSKSGTTETTRVFEGWIPKKHTKKLNALIDDIPKGVTLEWLEQTKNDLPPTKVSNPGGLSGFEKLVEAFGTPNTKELDPTLLVAITFPIIFGMMFGDLGHGAVLFLVGVLAYFYSKTPKPKGEIIGYFTKGSVLLILSGLASMFFGLLYAECFGWELIHEIWYEDLVTLIGPFLDSLGIREGGTSNHFIWFSPTENPYFLFIMSIRVAVIHVNLGLLINAFNYISQKKISKAFFGSICWMWFYVGSYFIIFSAQFSLNVIEWLDDLMLNTVTSPIFYLFVLPLLLMVLGGSMVEIKHTGNVVDGFTEGALHAFEAFIESLSNTISYSRILALAIVHASLSKTFLVLAGSDTYHFLTIPFLTIPGTIIDLVMFIVLFMIGTIFVLILEGLLTFFQSLRLIWVEFFLKFYTGDGTPYTPLQLTKSYSPLNLTSPKKGNSNTAPLIEVS
jgi:V/A-type H+-transporting ATPase subunit I